MPQKLGRDIEVHIAGSVTGQVAVGDNNVQVTAGPGAVVTVLGPGERPVPRPRARPVRALPRPFPGLLGRAAELARAGEGLLDGGPLDLHGPAGIGKTAFLRHLSHLPPSAAEGVAYAPVAGLPLEDVLQALFELAYETDVPFKPGQGDLRHLLGGLRMLFILDDVGLAREEVEALAGFVPSSTFALASEERRIWGEGVALALGGLPVDAGVELFERELGRSLTDDGRAGARTICEALGGHPLGILQAAAAIRSEDRSVEEAAAAFAPGTAAAMPGDDEERGVLRAFGGLGGAALPAEVLGAAAGLEDPRPALERLASTGLLVEEAGRYRPAAAPVDEPDAAAAERLTAAVEADPEKAKALAGAPAALLALVRHARAAGRDETATRLARAVDGPLTLERRWGVWRLVLNEAHEAAARSRNGREQGWALHQLGSRALCLGEREEARGLLQQALEVRREAGDGAGVIVTRHNLEQLGPSGPPPPEEPEPHPDPPPGWGRRLLVGAVVVAAVVGGGVGAQRLLDREERVEIPPAETGGQGEETEPPAEGGGTPALAAESEALDFGGVAVGGRGDPLIARFSNGGDGTLTIEELVVEGDHAGDFVPAGSTCGETLGPGAACEVALVFAPAEAGERLASLVLRGEGLEASVALRGAGLVAQLEVSPAELDFGSTFPGQAGPTQQVSVTNTGGAPARVTAVFVEGLPDDWAITDGCTGTELPAGGGCSIAVTFTPVDGGDRTSQLVIQHDAPGGEARVVLAGSGATVD
ncbi:MAG TPA: choice-of-anchor D domain-containing protein [Actinomycetota bacterium]